ncbi:MAG: hypothetical protein ABFS45_19930 [Pseudomonadota bacterium]
MADNETPASKGAGSDEQASVKKTAARKKASPQKKTSPRKKAAPKKKSVPKKKAAPKKKTTAKKKPIPKRQAEKEAAAVAAAKQAETPKVSPDKTQQAPVAESKKGVTPPPTTTGSTKKKKMVLWPWVMLLALGGAAVYLLNGPLRTGDQATDQSPASAAAKKDTQSSTPAPVTADESSVPAMASTDTATQAEAEQISPTPETTQTESPTIPSTQTPDTTVSEGVTPPAEDTKPAETPEAISMKPPPVPGAEESPNPQRGISNLEAESREISPGPADTAIAPSTDKASVPAVESGPGEEQVGTATPEMTNPEEQAQGPVASPPKRLTEDAPATESETEVKPTQEPITPPTEQMSPPAPADQLTASGEANPIIAEEISGSGVAKTTSPQTEEKPSPNSTNGAYTPKRMAPPANAWTNYWQARRQYRTPYNYRPYYPHLGHYPYGYYYGRRAPYTVYNPYLRRWDILR